MNHRVGRAHIINDYGDLCDQLRGERPGKIVVCTIGSWDILHSGHVEYLRRAREQGDILVVGVDSDLAYERYKKKQVLYTQRDRQEIVSAVRDVDYVTVVDDVGLSGEWQMRLVEATRPDVFVCNEISYSVEQRKKLDALCSLRILPFFVPATITSSAVVSEQIKSMFFFEQRSRVRMRVAAFCVLITMFALSISTSLTMVVLEGFGKVTLQPGLFNTLVLKSTPELLAMTYLVIRYLFPGGGETKARLRSGRGSRVKK